MNNNLNNFLVYRVNTIKEIKEKLNNILKIQD